jgi:GNAT superfamily N-acetyltransferase
VNPTLPFPPGFTPKPLSSSDLGIVTQLIAACEFNDDGVVEIDERDIAGEWARPSFDLATGSIGVFDRDRLVAAGTVCLGRAQVDVHPARRKRGLGQALLRWTWDVARSAGSDRVGQVVSDNRAGAAELFLANGYEVAHHSWILRIDLDGAIESQTLPRGLAIRDFVPGADDRPVFDLIETAFAEWSDLERETFDDWRATTIGRADVAPWQILLVEDIERARIIGAAVTIDYASAEEGWIEQMRWTRPIGDKGSDVRCCMNRSADIESSVVRAVVSPPTRGPARSGSTSISACGSIAATRDTRSDCRGSRRGGRGIRTRERVAPLHALQACPFVRSGRPPRRFYGSAQWRRSDASPRASQAGRRVADFPRAEDSHHRAAGRAVHRRGRFDGARSGAGRSTLDPTPGSTTAHRA